MADIWFLDIILHHAKANGFIKTCWLTKTHDRAD